MKMKFKLIAPPKLPLKIALKLMHQQTTSPT
jgi:hypothetical protein